MFRWLRNRKIARLAKAADMFTGAYYKDPAEASGEPSGRIQYSRRVRPEEPHVTQGDRYDSRSVDRAVRTLPTAEALRALEENTNMSFVDKMLDYIRIGHRRDADVYKAAQIDRRLFSKIVSDRTYKPAKDTCIALSLALRLGLPEASDLLSRAGYVLSHSSKRDLVIEYFFRERVYDLNDVNEVLFRLGQKPIGR